MLCALCRWITALGLGLGAVPVVAGEASAGGCGQDPVCADGEEDVALLQKTPVLPHTSGVHVVDAGAPEAASESDEDSTSVVASEPTEPRALLVADMGPYFRYNGKFHVEGQVEVTSTGLLETGAQELSWMLHGVDSRCVTVGHLPNSCGIHIHEATTCYAEGGPHYYKSPEDPWKIVGYAGMVGSGDTSEGAFGSPVVTWLSGFDVLSRVIVVHDWEGARVACGLLVPTKLFVPAFEPYFNYEGDLAVRGEMSLDGSGVLDDGSQTLSWKLSGLDKRCWHGGSSEFGNSCGVHIHHGVTCDSDAGPHFFLQHWLNTVDPWRYVSYTSCGLTQRSHESGVKVVSGFANTVVNGHALIIHNFEGGRIACGIISPQVLAANTFVPYFSYEGSLKVSGWVSAAAKGVGIDSAQVLAWDLSGLDPACAEPPAAGASPNACGIHIHENMTCTEDAGGHFYDKTISPDPWHAVKYVSGGAQSTASSSQVTVVTGLTNFDVTGHTMIVHDSSGGRIACGILATAASMF